MRSASEPIKVQSDRLQSLFTSLLFRKHPLMIKSIISFLLLSGLVFSSCRKDEYKAEETISQKIARVNWLLFGVFVQSPPDPGTAEITDLLRYECEKDDEYRFDANGTFNVIEGSNDCNGSGKFILSALNSASWKANNSDSSLTINAGFNTQRFKVKEITNKLILEKMETDYFNQLTLYTYYFAPK